MSPLEQPMDPPAKPGVEEDPGPSKDRLLPRDHPTIAILLATYNGAAYLRAQLESYAAQSLRPALILISDDGSTDGSRDIVRDFTAANPDLRIELLDGPCMGSAQNFLSLIRRCPDWIDYIALSDQDDVWLRDKLERGLRALEAAAAAGPDRPRLFCGRSWECDVNLRYLHKSRGMPRPASFRHALVQNVAGGNTMMLNRAGWKLLQEGSRDTRKLVVHDWWIYQLVAGAGGEVLFDPEPLLLYRQHHNNLIGANRGLGAKRVRLRILFTGRFRRWNTVNIAALRASSRLLTEENRALLERFARGRNGPVLTRLAMLFRTGLYRQGVAAQMSLYLAALLRRL